MKNRAFLVFFCIFFLLTVNKLSAELMAVFEPGTLVLEVTALTTASQTLSNSEWKLWISQIIWDYFKKTLLFKAETIVATFRATFWKIWATFYSSIRSHWLERANLHDHVSLSSSIIIHCFKLYCTCCEVMMEPVVTTDPKR